MSHAEKCPICKGTGTKDVPIRDTMCHGCNGKGWIELKDEAPAPYPVPYPIEPIYPWRYPVESRYPPGYIGPYYYQYSLTDGANLSPEEVDTHSGIEPQHRTVTSSVTEGSVWLRYAPFNVRTDSPESSFSQTATTDCELPKNGHTVPSRAVEGAIWVRYAPKDIRPNGGKTNG